MPAHNENPLTDEEISKLFAELDKSGDGVVTFNELEAGLLAVYEELAPEPKEHHLTHATRRKASAGGKRTEEEKDALHVFLYSLLPEGKDRLTQDEFRAQVKQWDVQSFEKRASDEDEDGTKEASAYEHRLTWARRARAHWSVEGPRYLFLACVVALQLAFGIWQMVTYIKKTEARAALGWGVIVAKASAGALYPTLLFMLLSMSRWLATGLRRFQGLSRVVNWDLSQSFHVIMSCAGLALATLHAIGHMTGTFLYGSRPAQQDNLALLIGPEATPKSYHDFIRSLPGWSGLTAFAMFWTIALLSMPRIRRRSYELFQLAHLLMFPMVGLLAAHGTAKLLQAPMLGYWLVVPVLLVLAERSYRVYRGFASLDARITSLDDATVTVVVERANGKPWRFQAGQWIYLQVPALSRWQWHPFTISACVGDRLQVHIKTSEGNWTGQLQAYAEKLAAEQGEGKPSDGVRIRVGVDGPFGAPAQRFYDYDRSIVVGAGIGVTPFSAILLDLEQKYASNGDPWALSRRRSSFSRTVSRTSARVLSRVPSRSATAMDATPLANDAEAKNKVTHDDSHATHAPRRVDFHWSVRSKDDLLWFSTLLNRAADLASPGCLDLRIVPHVTQKRKTLSAKVFRALLDRHRTREHPYSALTGLKARTSFGRPDLGEGGIIDQFDDDMRKEGWTGGKVGVFFCGPPAIGRMISDRCAELTARARADGTNTRYIFMIEVFD